MKKNLRDFAGRAKLDPERWPQPNSTTYRYLIAGGTTTQVGATSVTATVSGSDMRITTSVGLGTSK